MSSTDDSDEEVDIVTEDDYTNAMDTACSHCDDGGTIPSLLLPPAERLDNEHQARSTLSSNDSKTNILRNVFDLLT